MPHIEQDDREVQAAADEAEKESKTPVASAPAKEKKEVSKKPKDDKKLPKGEKGKVEENLKA